MQNLPKRASCGFIEVDKNLANIVPTYWQVNKWDTFWYQ